MYRKVKPAEFKFFFRNLGRAPHPYRVLLMLLLTVEICEGGSTPITLLIVSREREHKHLE